MKISALCQSPVRQGGNSEQALSETVALAEYLDVLGYDRFWVSEHHSTAAYAGSAPEVLLAAIGARTKTIRLGTGGIMLPHYSEFKVAEVASVLASLYPGRVDIGFGRAIGAGADTARELAGGGGSRFHLFPQMVEGVVQKLSNKRYRPKLFPRPAVDPVVWMLGTSSDSAALAGRLGLPYNFALFINPDMRSDVVGHYKESFVPSEQLATPYSCLTINVYCADTEEKARQLAQARHLSLLRVVTGAGFSGIGSIDEAKNYPYGDQELEFISQRSRLDAIGTPEQVKAQIEGLQAMFGVDEIMTVTITYDFDDRKRSYELLAEVMGLKGGAN
ncbi:MAG: LLM class flavin-dependent oxidoreductase [Spongiibacteraceae bacterium]